MSSKKKKIVKLFEKPNSIKDKLVPKGDVFIKVIDKNGNIVNEIHKHNTVLQYGRNVLFQTITKASYTVKDIYGNNVSGLTNHEITHFCVGTGGATETSPFTPIAPQETDYKLATPINIGTSILEPIDNKTFTADPAGSSALLTMEFTLFLDYNQANGSGLAPINEAGLVLTDASTNANPVMFSRLTFPSIPKTQDVAIEFYWYIYF